MTANRMPKMPSMKTSARSATQPSAQAPKAQQADKRSDSGKDTVKSFDQLGKLVGA